MNGSDLRVEFLSRNTSVNGHVVTPAGLTVKKKKEVAMSQCESVTVKLLLVQVLVGEWALGPKIALHRDSVDKLRCMLNLRRCLTAEMNALRGIHHHSAVPDVTTHWNDFIGDLHIQVDGVVQILCEKRYLKIKFIEKHDWKSHWKFKNKCVIKPLVQQTSRQNQNDFSQ